MSIEKGSPGGVRRPGPPISMSRVVTTRSASAVAAHPHARIVVCSRARLRLRARDRALRFGRTSSAPGTTELPCDALRVEIDGRELLAVNMVVLGVPPDRQRWSSGTSHVVVRDRRPRRARRPRGRGGGRERAVPARRTMSCHVAIRVTAASRCRCTRSRVGERAAMRAATAARRASAAPADPVGVRPAGRDRDCRLSVRARSRRAARVEVDGVSATPARAKSTVAVVPAAFTLLV